MDGDRGGPGEPDPAADLLAQAHAVHRAASDEASLPRDLTNLAEIACVRGDLATADGHARAALEAYRRIGSRVGEGAALDTLALVHHRSGRALAISRDAGYRVLEERDRDSLPS